MDIKQIEEIYREMGIGTQDERDKFLKWSTIPQGENDLFFIIDTADTTDVPEVYQES